MSKPFEEDQLYLEETEDFPCSRDYKLRTSKIKRQYERFICDYTINDETTCGLDVDIYREQLLRLRDHLYVNLDDLFSFDPVRARNIENDPDGELPLFEQAASSVLATHKKTIDESDAPEVQVMLHRSTNESSSTISIRDLTSDKLSSLVKVRGIITAASKPRSKATEICIQCQNCNSMEQLMCGKGVGAVSVPRQCKSRETADMIVRQKCPLDPFFIIPERCRHIDQQMLKLQELTEDVKDGDTPRSLVLVVDRFLVNKVIPGVRVTIYGVFSINPATANYGENERMGVRQPYIRVVGIDKAENYIVGRSVCFRDKDCHEFYEFAVKPNAEEMLFNMIGPNIFGHEHVKKAIACLLFGCSRRKFPDGGTLRGDINVLLLGDPSTAKSQFLKFVEKSAPIAVYTSGKGSSAAGLTAAVIRDPGNREFYLEGGAMVLADGGVVCIDEFDKMRSEDRVAIHEAMEQQTISIAKAGITAVLNSRTAVLAAANPPSGRYDNLRSAEENIDLQTTILSRFDMIFLIRDERLEEKDIKIARHVCSVHRNIETERTKTYDVTLNKQWDFLKRYVSFARTRGHPNITKTAESILVAQYVKYRELRRSSTLEEVPRTNRETDQFQPQNVPLPITVRQLEALIRISEAFCRLTLSSEVNGGHVEKAIKLFEASTAEAAKFGITETIFKCEEEKKELIHVIAIIRRYILIGQIKSEMRLVDEVLQASNVDRFIVHKALSVMRKAADITYLPKRHMIKRIR